MAELHLDLSVMECNAAGIAAIVKSSGKLWRPHVKAHSHPNIAQLLMNFGASGFTCANVDEVEAMVSAGAPSVLLAHLVVDPLMLDRLAAARRRAQILLTIDHFVHAERLVEAACRNAVEFEVLIDVNIGLNRTGIRPRVDAARLAVAASKLPGIRVVGIMGYEGHLLRIPDVAEKRRAILEAMNVLAQTRDALKNDGVCCDIVSAGGSGSFWISGQHEAVTELQAGGGIFGDPFYTRSCGLTGVEPALTVTADVVSRPSLEQAVLNAGRKAINPELQMPEVLGIPGASIDSMSAEHTVLKLEGAARDLRIGDPVRLIVGYSDHTILLHRRIHVYRGTEKIDVWPVVRD